MGVASPVSEILLLSCLSSKWPKFPFRPWTIVHGSQKIELAQKFMQVEVDVKCMETKFGGVASLVSEILLLFKFGQIALSNHGL